MTPEQRREQAEKEVVMEEKTDVPKHIIDPVVKLWGGKGNADCLHDEGQWKSCYACNPPQPVEESQAPPASPAQLSARASEQHTICAGCGEDKPTPLRRDDMGGYVCLTCVDSELSTLRTALAHAEEQIREMHCKLNDQWARVLDERDEAREQLAEKDEEIERLKDEVDFRNGESGRLVNRINQMSEAWTLTESARVASESRSRKLEQALRKLIPQIDGAVDGSVLVEPRRVLEEGSQP